MKKRILKSSQLDAHELDQELQSLFKEKIKDLFKDINPTKFEPELKAVLDWIIYSSLLTKRSTYGLYLQNLIYKNSFKKIRLFVFTKVFGNWAWNRFNQYMRDHEWSDSSVLSMKFQIWSRVQQTMVLWESFSLLQFITFLYTGRYPSVMEWIFGMKMEYQKSEMSRMISFEFMNRQLVWQAMTEFIISMIPFISQFKWGRVKRKEIPPKVCAFCYEKGDVGDIQIPFAANCGHVFCYYCVSSRIIADPKLSCPHCSAVITEINRVEPPRKI
jgi:peroxin-2